MLRERGLVGTEVQSNPLKGSTVFPNNKRIEPINQQILLIKHYEMGLSKIWAIKQIEPISGDPLSGFDCIIQGPE